MPDVQKMADTVFDAVTAYVVRALVPLAERIKMLEERELPAGPQGEQGNPGQPGEQGRPGEPGAPGEPGRDGRDGLPGLTGEKGADGRDGIDGRDGFGFDDLSVDHDGERTITLRFQRGEEVKVFPIVLALPLYRGVYRHDASYVRGDLVTFGGSIFHANADTADKPEESGGAWTLATKRGRDGKNGKDGEKGDRGLDGKPGRDLTELERRMA